MIIKDFSFITTPSRSAEYQSEYSTQGDIYRLRPGSQWENNTP